MIASGVGKTYRRFCKALSFKGANSFLLPPNPSISITVPPSLFQALKISRDFLPPRTLPSAPALLRLPETPSSLPPAVQIHSHLLLPRSSPAATQDPPSDSTRTLSSLLALALSVSKLILSLPAHITIAATRAVPSSVELAEIQDLRESLACAVGPLFFTALKDRPRWYLKHGQVARHLQWGPHEMVESMKKSKREMPIAANSSGRRSLGRVAVVVVGVALLLSLFLCASPDLLLR